MVKKSRRFLQKDTVYVGLVKVVYLGVAFLRTALIVLLNDLEKSFMHALLKTQISREPL